MGIIRRRGAYGSTVTAPTASISSPTSSFTYLEGDSITVSGTCTNSTSVEAFLKVGAGSWQSLGTDSSVGDNTFSVTHNADSGYVGSVTIKVTATGDGGSVDSTTVSGTVNPLPTVTINDMTGFVFNKYDVIGFNGTNTNTSAVALQKNINSSGWSTWDTDSSVGGGTWSLSESLTSLSYLPAPSSFRASCSGTYGGTATSTTYSGYIMDNTLTAPSDSFSIPHDSAPTTLTTTISLASGQPSLTSIAFYSDLGYIADAVDMGGGTWSYDWTPTSGDVGTRYIWAQYDCNGYTSYSNTISGTVT